MTQQWLDGMDWQEGLGYVGWSPEHALVHGGWSPIKVGYSANLSTYRARCKKHYKKGYWIVGNWVWSRYNEQKFHDTWPEAYHYRLPSSSKNETYYPEKALVDDVVRHLEEKAQVGQFAPERGWHLSEITDQLYANAHKYWLWKNRIDPESGR